ncbi:bifunctional prephenate dehydrogenase/3-phosphoshikimate 1-carboxyvinyltransferase [Moraxella caviae]|uniref:3-phosphoshikimate 1-carboxyvinyltransferase n=1 Tax=Moraxella caviae TaxID=34060 RepID=A0A1S9ZZQ4_9GAMM|nr:bifunctional prephenate dehydrogenase/3-phosphoshikimate 1-carboxyvinyltransferase [Moraxella caviae]OOR89002.1 bifunctional prephenate dehydrogenase/3-phosphoshikimate 1-carboxyvinyltransferase [Moraxella caviae]STZ14756.1 3-phosphoshikimate 1-carboxyvinyltransferase [Moraxella caviae]VEW13991.1 3-phosphoshikimate 1-carboxyvinyltransferase [Moraxella caviae]
MTKNRHALPCERLCVIGLGLIGASFAQGIKNHALQKPHAALAKQIVAVDTSQDSITDGVMSGLLDAGSTDVYEGVAGADVIVIAVPVQALAGVLGEIKRAMDAGKLAKECIISDVSSTKQSVLEAARGVFGQVPPTFVPAHPIAGAENSGFHARNPELFCHHKVIICPHERTDDVALNTVQTLWQTLGADVIFMDSARHDEILAYTSHLPHLLAFALTEQLAGHDDNLDIFRYAAGGFRDFSRIAASHPVMWHDIFMANKQALLTALDAYQAQLTRAKQMIQAHDTSINAQSEPLLQWLATARHARRHFGHMLAGKPKTSLSNQDDTMSQSYYIQPQHDISGVISVPGDKSISHRSIMFGSLADGVTRVSGFLQGEDALATLQAFSDMGVKIERTGDQVVIHGVGIDGLSTPKNPLYMGNSGTSMRLLAGILSAQKFDSVMTGDVSLSKRPMERVAVPLRQMGAKIQSTGEKGTAPLSITGNQTLNAIHYELPVASAQIKSCLILAALWAQGETVIVEPEVSRDHTERMLNAFGYPVVSSGREIRVTGGGRLSACDIIVPADISSAAFFMVLAAIGGGEGLTIQKVGMNPTRTGVIDILRLMGADITVSNETVVGGEPIADITVRPSDLQGIDIPEHLVPLAIDEFPVLFVAASCATGTTRLTGAKELRVKESDRIAVMADGLSALGVDCTVLEDGIIINGKGVAGTRNAVFGGGEIESHHDHRIAMSFAVASARAADEIVIHGTETVATSFPNFADLANRVGLKIDVK